jgi:plasmid maintenance system antidote protein VapI
MSERDLYPAKPIDVAIPPGETLWELINERDLNLVRLAADTGLSPEALERIVLGLKVVDSDIARRLEIGTGVSARLWSRLQADYDRARRRA